MPTKATFDYKLKPKIVADLLGGKSAKEVSGEMDISVHIISAIRLYHVFDLVNLERPPEVNPECPALSVAEKAGEWILHSDKARAYGATDDSIRDWRTYAASITGLKRHQIETAVTVLLNGCPQLVERFRRREIGVNEVKRLCSLSHDEQGRELRGMPSVSTATPLEDAVMHVSRILDVMSSWKQLHGDFFGSSTFRSSDPRVAELLRMSRIAKDRADVWLGDIINSIEDEEHDARSEDGEVPGTNGREVGISGRGSVH